MLFWVEMHLVEIVLLLFLLKSLCMCILFFINLYLMILDLVNDVAFLLRSILSLA